MFILALDNKVQCSISFHYILLMHTKKIIIQQWIIKLGARYSR